MKITTIGRFGAYPQPGEATAGYLLQTDDYNILIDCGSGVLSLLQQYINLDQIDAVILSHYHGDHIADILCLQYASLISMQLGKRQEPIKIYGNGKDPMFSKLTLDKYAIGIEIDDKSVLEFGSLRVKFLWTQHPQPCLAMRFEEEDKSIVYTGDTELFDGLVDFCQGASLLIAECSLYDEQKGVVGGHMTAGETGELSSRGKVAQLMLSHLPAYGDYDRLVEQAGVRFRGRVTLAEKGITIAVDEK